MSFFGIKQAINLGAARLEHRGHLVLGDLLLLHCLRELPCDHLLIACACASSKMPSSLRKSSMLEPICFLLITLPFFRAATKLRLRQGNGLNDLDLIIPTTRAVSTLVPTLLRDAAVDVGPPIVGYINVRQASSPISPVRFKTISERVACPRFTFGSGICCGHDGPVEHGDGFSDLKPHHQRRDLRSGE